MSAVIIGSPLSGAKVLNKQSYQRESNGLETIIETYLVRSVDRISLAPAKDTPHTSFSTATSKYSRMWVESINSEEQSGSISAMDVTYVGLTSSTGLPKPIVRMIPTTGAGLYGPPLTVEIEFVTDANEQQISTGGLTSDYAVPEDLLETNVNPSKIRTLMPPSLNGTTLPSSPRSPFTRQLGLLGGFTYWGYAQDNVSTTKRGQFLVARVVFKEKQTGYGSPEIVAAYTKL